MPCADCKTPYAEPGVTGPHTASAIPSVCLSCVARFFSEDGEPALGWQECVPFYEPLPAAQEDAERVMAGWLDTGGEPGDWREMDPEVAERVRAFAAEKGLPVPAELED